MKQKKTIINTIICLEIVEICVVYESVLKITKMENKIILKNVYYLFVYKFMFSVGVG